MIKECKHMVRLKVDSLLKREQLFVSWVQTLFQKAFQYIFQVGLELVRAVVDGRSELFFKFIRFYEHSPKSGRPDHFVTFSEVSGLTSQIGLSKLTFLYRGVEMDSPEIVDNCGFFRYLAHFFIDRSSALFDVNGNISSPIILLCPETIFVPFVFCTCSDESADKNILSYNFMSVNTFGQTMEVPLAFLNNKEVIERFRVTFKQTVLPYDEIVDEGLDTYSIYDWIININGKTTLHNISVSELTNPELGHYRFYIWDINGQNFPILFKRPAFKFFPVFGTKKLVIVDLLGDISHLKGVAIMLLLYSSFSAFIFSETTAMWWIVLVFQWGPIAVVAIFSYSVPGQLSFKYFYPIYQHGILFVPNHYDALKVFYNYFIGWYHIIYCETKPEIQYIEERDLLFVEHKNNNFSYVPIFTIQP